MANLEITIGGDASELRTEIAKAQTDIEKLGKQKATNIKLGIDTVELQKQINDSKSKLTDLKKSLDSTGASFNNMNKPVANGSNALTQFNRIVQDAPFGIVGVQNNVTSFAESFGYLVNQTGSARGALKAMAGTIMGTGGIMLGISLLTTALTYLSQSGLSVSDIFAKATGTFDEFGGSLKKASEEAAKSVAGEVMGLKALVSVAQDETKSRQDRLLAVDELQKRYPNYLGNLSKEKIMTSDLTGVVNELTSALLSKAVAEKLASESADVQLKVFAANAKLINQKNKTIALEKELAKLTQGLSNDEIMADNNRFIAVTNLNSEIRNSKFAENDYRDAILSGNKALEQRQGVINKLTSASIKLTSPVSVKKEKQAVKRKISVISELKPENTTDEQNDKILSMFKDRLSEDINKFKTEPIKLNIPIQSVFTPTQAEQDAKLEFQRLYGLLLEFEKEANELITGSLTDTFNSLGNSIGEALANSGNVFGAIGSSLLKSMGKFLSEMGGLLIKYGLLAVAKGKIDLALKTGINTVPLGIAAIAVGVALKAAGTSLGSRAQGGTSGSSGVRTGADYSSPSSGSYSSGNFGGGTVVFEISGNSLVGVLSNTLNKNTRLGGKLTI